MSPLDGTDGVCFQSGLCSSSELETSRGSIRIQHLTGSSHAAEQGAATRFPRLEECAHFHYEFAEIGPLQVGIVIIVYRINQTLSDDQVELCESEDGRQPQSQEESYSHYVVAVTSQEANHRSGNKYVCTL